MALGHAQVRDGLAAAYGELGRLARALDDGEFALPTRCAGWCVRDLLFHQMLDGQRALIALATPTDIDPDRDLVSYWREPDDTAPAAEAHAEYVRRSAAAYARPQALVEQFVATLEAAVRAAAAADPGGRIRTQGHVLAVPDFLATLVLEAVVHRLDLPQPVTTAPAATAVAEAALVGLLGRQRPHAMAPDRFALVLAGREPLDPSEAALLGPAAARVPVL